MTPRDAAHAAADRELLSRVPDDWEGDLATAHPNRCLLRDRLLYADILNDDGSHRATWRCHKRAGHEGPCSSHNDCGVMNGGVVCGNLPGHRGPHAWQTSIVLDAYAERDLYVRQTMFANQKDVPPVSTAYPRFKKLTPEQLAEFTQFDPPPPLPWYRRVLRWLRSKLTGR